MQKSITKGNKIHRLIDANANRLREGLRVLEDISRFIIEDKHLSREYKKARHEITGCLDKNSALATLRLIKERQVKTDVGKKTIVTELKRKNVADIFFANSQRVKESTRVLEEFFKLRNKNKSARLKVLRYKIYNLEKRAIEKIA